MTVKLLQDARLRNAQGQKQILKAGSIYTGEQEQDLLNRTMAVSVDAEKRETKVIQPESKESKPAAKKPAPKKAAKK